MTRHQRRKARTAAIKAKIARRNKALLARQGDYVDNIRKNNLSNPHNRERNYYAPIQDSVGSMAGQSHRAYICKG